MARRTDHSNPFESPSSEGQPSRVLRSKSRRVLFRCVGWLSLLASILPVCVILFLIRQDYLRSDRYSVLVVINDFELVGVGEGASGLLLAIAVVLTLAMWAGGTTLLLLSRKR